MIFSLLNRWRFKEYSHLNMRPLVSRLVDSLPLHYEIRLISTTVNRLSSPSSDAFVHMNVGGLTKEQADLRWTVRRFMEKEIPLELAAKIDRNNVYENFRGFFAKLGSMGFLGPTAPQKYGGLEMGYLENCLIMEEISRVCPSLGLSYGAHSNLCVNQISLNGSERQREKYLPKLIAGTDIGALAMSEPWSGSDVTSMRLKAEKKGQYSSGESISLA